MITLSTKQRGVLRGMLTALVASILLILATLKFDPFNLAASDRATMVSIAILCTLAPALLLAVCIGRLAKHRFFSEQDIDGGGLSIGTERAKVLQSILQNTLEQSVLAVMVWLAWAHWMPLKWTSTIVLGALLFTLGRLLFFAGYQHGAPARALGFALTFYPSVVMLIIVIVQASSTLSISMA